MSFVLGTMLTRIAFDVGLAFAAFFVGVAAAVAYSRYGRGRTAPRRRAEPSVEPPSPSPSPTTINEAARAAMAAQQLRELAANVATDVGAHNSLVEGIASQLEALGQGEAGNSAVVMEAVARIIDANRKLATRLDDAEHKIQTQAEEIRVQQTEARTDALTRLANRRAFDARLEECIEAAAAGARSPSLLMFDVDHFKRFNDAHGHQAGDEVLRAVGQTLKGCTAPSDLACRYGGEEFAVILADAPIDRALTAAERVRSAIEAMAVRFAGETLRVTASVGVAPFTNGDDSLAIVRRADEAVYASKKSGRNCCHVHDGQEVRRLDPMKPPRREPPARKPTYSAPSLPPDAVNVPDRTAFANELDRRIAESGRFGFPVTLLYFRIKDYKKLQHDFGDAIGALLVDSLASFIQSTLRDMDLLGKLEDGELIVMLPGSTAAAAKIVGQRVRTSTSLCPVPLGGQQIRLDLEMGVTTVEPGDRARAAIARSRADLDATAAAEAAERRLHAERDEAALV
jgi:diguanylate cyclase